MPQIRLLDFRRTYWVFSLVSGLLLGATLGWWLAWFALAPLWWLTFRCKSRWTALSCGALWGVAYHGSALFWLWGLHPLTWLGIPWIGSIAIAGLSWLVVTLWGAIFTALWAVLVHWLAQRYSAAVSVWVGTTLWCGLEALWRQSPLWWTDLANTQSPTNTAILHLAQLSGPTAIAAILLLVNGCLAVAIHRQRLLPLALALGIFLGAWGLGWGLAQTSLPSDTALRIGLIQGNLPSRLKLTPKGQQQSIQQYTADYLALAEKGVDAVLMPEGALPFQWGRSPTLERPVVTAIQQAQVPAFIGTFRPTQMAYTQSLITVDGDGSLVSQYDKVKLVPLGESLPPALGNLIRRLSPVELVMLPGSLDQTIHTPIGQPAVSICYDSVFPNLLRRQVGAGATFILSVANNDPFSPRMMAQHHALDVLRAIETQRWLVRSTNTGLSAVIGPDGQTLWRSQPNVRITHIATIHPLITRTLYVTFGDWLLGLLLTSVGVLLIPRFSAPHKPIC